MRNAGFTGKNGPLTGPLDFCFVTTSRSKWDSRSLLRQTGSGWLMPPCHRQSHRFPCLRLILFPATAGPFRFRWLLRFCLRQLRQGPSLHPGVVAGVWGARWFFRSWYRRSEMQLRDLTPYVRHRMGPPYLFLARCICCCCRQAARARNWAPLLTPGRMWLEWKASGSFASFGAKPERPQSRS